MTPQQLAQQHRAAILKREAEARKRLAEDYRTLWERLYVQLQLLLQKIQQAKANGQDVKISWLYEAGRLQSLLDQVNGELSRFADTARQDTAQRAYHASLFGSQDALKLLETAFAGRRAGVYATFAHLPTQAIDALHQRFQPGSKLAKVFDSFAPDAVKRVKATLLYGVGAGIGARELAYQIKHDLGVELNRALRLSRTEMMESYRAGTLEIYRANADVVETWEWLAAPGACPFCESMNGSIHPLSESMVTHPNCRCVQLPRTRSYQSIFDELAQSA